MSNENKFKKQYLAYIIVPPILICAVYFIFINPSAIGVESSTSKNDTEAILLPNSELTNDTLNSKVKIYERAGIEKGLKENQERREASTFNDMVKSMDSPKNSEIKEDTNMDFSKIASSQKIEVQKVKETKPVQVNQNSVVKKQTSTNKTFASTSTKPQIKQEAKIKEETIVEDKPTRKSGFLSNTLNSKSSTSTQNEKTQGIVNSKSFKVQADRNEEVFSGQTLHFKLMETSIIDGKEIPKGTRLTAMVSVSGERLFATLNSFKIANEIIRPYYQLYDVNGSKGLYAPFNINQEIGQDGVQRSADKAGTTITIPIIGGSVSTNALKRKVGNKAIPVPLGWEGIFVYEPK